LQSNATFQSYSWNNGAVSSEITIGTPGTYWLQVTDDNNCTGRDSIIVRSKDCISGFNIPNAFTPNGDGLNDLFRPAIAGNISKYQFAVYDRQGKPVFTSAEPGKGWDGTIGGKDAVGSSYIWSCIYQVDGQPSKSETGTVLLIR
jgi:gliding motility-associated-like protein